MRPDQLLDASDGLMPEVLGPVVYFLREYRGEEFLWRIRIGVLVAFAVTAMVYLRYRGRLREK